MFGTKSEQMSDYKFRKAALEDAKPIWGILQQAIVRRKNDGSNQWQDGYPNAEVVEDDIRHGVGYVLTHGSAVVGYAAVLVSDEPEYAKIEGKWLTDGDFLVVHRVAIADDYLGRGLAMQIMGFVEEVAKALGIVSIKVDTNFDNVGMLKTLDRMGYVYCGKVHFRGSPRRAYEKVLNINI